MFEVIIGATISGFIYALDKYKATQKEKVAIIRALNEAITLTEHHIAESRDEQGGREASTELYRTWNRLADLIKKFDPANARIFQDKSQYWLKPNAWLDQVNNADNERSLNMTLENVRTEYWGLKTRWKVD